MRISYTIGECRLESRCRDLAALSDAAEALLGGGGVLLVAPQREVLHHGLRVGGVQLAKSAAQLRYILRPPDKVHREREGWKPVCMHVQRAIK